MGLIFFEKDFVNRFQQINQKFHVACRPKKLLPFRHRGEQNNPFFKFFSNFKVSG